MTAVSDPSHDYILMIKISQERIHMLRKEKATLTKNRLFEAAIELIKKNGYDNVTISEICTHAGVAKGTFYVHYNSKEDIIKESYYSDMDQFVLNTYQNLISQNRDLSIKDKIGIFLMSELMFTAHAGYEMTCRAYVINLTECISKDSSHFKRRRFAEELKILISQGVTEKAFETDQTEDEIFLYLESFVRGLMASWCFSNGEFDIVRKGEKCISELLKNL